MGQDWEWLDTDERKPVGREAAKRNGPKLMLSYEVCLVVLFYTRPLEQNQNLQLFRKFIILTCFSWIVA